MHYDIPLVDLGFGDLNIVISGAEDCAPGHFYGPAVREYYLLHYIIKGEGIFRYRGHEYTLGTRKGFLIYPREITYYEASKTNPWTYIWIGFSGTRAIELLEQIGIDIDQPIINSPECEELFNSIMATSDMKSGRELYLLSILYRIFSILTKNVAIGEKSYARKAAGYISANIGQELKIATISKLLGLDRRYFCQVFKKEYGLSPQQYLVKVRMESAKSLLGNTTLNVSDISRSVGYADALAFSKQFKKYYNYSPTKFRKTVYHTQ